MIFTEAEYRERVRQLEKLQKEKAKIFCKDNEGYLRKRLAKRTKEKE